MRAYEFLTEAPTKQQLKYMQRIYAKMQENPAVIDELWNVISTKIADDEGGMQSRIVTSLQPANTKPEEDQTYGTGFLEGLVDAIDKTEGTVEEKIAFATTLGQADHIDTKALLQPLSGWGEGFNKIFSKRRKDHNAYNSLHGRGRRIM